MTGTAVERIVRGLRKARLNGVGWIACCPHHRDNNPSLSVTEVDGKVLVHCFGGCEQQQVIDALKRMGLWTETQRPFGRLGPRVETTHDYVDEGGKLLFQSVRYQPKNFRQRRPDGRGGWIWNLQGVRLVPYRLPSLFEAPVCFIAEGERDCDTLAHYGFVATTNPMGAGKWRPDFNQYFAAKEVIILPDADRVGWQHALDIARSLVGVASLIQLLELPGAKDAAEWFELGHSEVELIHLVELEIEQCHP